MSRLTSTLLWTGALMVVLLTGLLLADQPTEATSKTADTETRPAEQKKESVPVNPGAFMTETMAADMAGDAVQLLIWLPHEFFIQTNMQEEGLSRAEAEKNMGMLEPYQLILVARQVDPDIGPKKQADEAVVRRTTAIVCADGKEVKPVKPDQINKKTRMVASMMKAAIQQSTPGLELHLLVFPSRNAKGEPLVNETARDKLTLQLKADGPFPAFQHVFRTPFDAASPKVKCPKCKEAVSAKWNFCAWCGQKL